MKPLEALANDLVYLFGFIQPEQKTKYHRHHGANYHHQAALDQVRNPGVGFHLVFRPSLKYLPP
jgi:hypothetical protein